MPRLPKPKPLRQNSETQGIGELTVITSGFVVPQPAAEWLPASKGDWLAYWQSPLATALLPATDEPAVRRLFGLRDERERMMRGIGSDRVVQGFNGQPRANPLYAQVAAFDNEIRQLEDRLGLNPMARLRLGISLGEAQRSLPQIAAAVNGDDSAAAADVLLAFAGPPAIKQRTGRSRVDGEQPRPRAGRRTGRAV